MAFPRGKSDAHRGSVGAISDITAQTISGEFSLRVSLIHVL